MSPNSSLRRATAPSSETNLSLSPKSDVISLDTVPSSSKAISSSSKTVTKLKLRRKPGTDHSRAHDHHDQIGNQEPSSPYYKGLLHQSTAIDNEYGSQNHLNSGGGHNNNSNSRVSTSAAASEGSTYQCSPYFKGLLTNSPPAMAIRKIHGGGGGGASSGHGGVVPTSLSSLASNMTFCLGSKDDQISNDNIRAAPMADSAGGERTLSSLISDEVTTLMESERQIILSALSPPAPIPLPSPSLPLPPPPPPPPLSMFTSNGGSTASSMELRIEEDGKPLGGRESEETEEEKAVYVENNKEEKEAMNNEQEAGLPNEEEVIKKKKSLRESVSNNISEQTVVSASSSSSSSSSESSSNKDIPHQEIKEEKEEGILIKDYVWADKYQPKALQEFICHKNIVSQLLTMIKEGCVCYHYIFEGPPGVGKRTMIRALLREVFGHDQVKVIEEYKTFLLKGEVIGSIQVPIIRSEHHIEVNLSQTKGYKEQVVADLLRETYDKIINNSMPCVPKNCQAIIIYEAETLSTESLLYIKWMLERYNKGCNKVFFCCADESKLQIVKTICKTFRLSPPSTQEIVEVLEYIRKQEGKELSREFLTKVVEKSKNNLRQAIRSLEATCQNKDSIKEDELILTGWEYDMSNIAKNILKEQSSKQLYTIHVKLQSLMIHKVSPDFVFKYLVSELNSLLDESLKPGFEKLKKEYSQKVYGMKMKSGKHSGHAHNKEKESDERNNETPKKIARSYSEVDEFIAKFMSWYKSSSAAKSDNT